MPAPSDLRPHSVVKCVGEVFVWGFGVLFLSCVSVSVSEVLFSVGVCVGGCELFLFSHPTGQHTRIQRCFVCRYARPF